MSGIQGKRGSRFLLGTGNFYALCEQEGRTMGQPVRRGVRLYVLENRRRIG